MHTKIHWARKSQQPDDTSWTFVRETGAGRLANCRADENDNLTTDEVITYRKHESSQITDKVNSG